MAHEQGSGQDTGEGAGRRVARNSTLDIVVSALVLVLGLVVVVEARRLGAGWTSDGPGAGYFPFYIGLILVIGAGVNGVQAWLARHTDDSVFVDKLQLKRVLQVLVPSLLYTAAIMVLGLYVASAVFIALFMIILGKYPVPKSVLVGLIVNAVFFAMFEVWFKVPLYKGALDPLAFLGY
jgi:Tripartite tricarboxylate transporter TctB family